MNSDKALGVFTEANSFRQFAYRISENQGTDNALMVCIVMSCVATSFETPAMDPDGETANILCLTGIIFTLIFTVEFVLMIIVWAF